MAKLGDILRSEFEAISREGMLHAVRVESWKPLGMPSACPLEPVGRTFSTNYACPPILSRGMIPWRPVCAALKDGDPWLHVQQYIFGDLTNAVGVDQRLHQRLATLSDRAWSMALTFPSTRLWPDRLHACLDLLFQQESVAWGLMLGDVTIRPGSYLKRHSPRPVTKSLQRLVTLRTILPIVDSA